MDLDRYGTYPFDSLPRRWDEALARWKQLMHLRLTEAFKEGNGAKILKLSAELGHYGSDAHVPLHTTGNYNGQRTGQPDLSKLSNVTFTDEELKEFEQLNQLWRSKGGDGSEHGAP